jgi:hypothetical protein
MNTVDYYYTFNTSKVFCTFKFWTVFIVSNVGNNWKHHIFKIILGRPIYVLTDDSFHGLAYSNSGHISGKRNLRQYQLYAILIF